MAFLIPAAITGLGAIVAYGVAVGVGQGLAKFVAGLGVGFLTFQGADALITQNQQQIFDLLSALPPLAVSLLGVLKIGTCIKIIFSALLMRLTIFGLDQGVIRRMRLGTPS